MHLCIKICIEIFQSKSDSVFLAVGKIYDKSLRKLLFTDTNNKYSNPITCIKLDGQGLETTFKVESFLIQTWDFAPQSYSFSMTPSWYEMKRSLQMNLRDSSNINPWNKPYAIRGYPKIDTIIVSL
jgi:hypothetical protein